MDEELVSLQFNEPLSWRAGKPIATGELLRRLEKLSKELVDMDQESVNKRSLHKVASELASPNLLNHKETGVKAFAASCLVDTLKLCAPEAPFTPKQLKVSRLDFTRAAVSHFFLTFLPGHIYPLCQSHSSCFVGSHQRLQCAT